MADPDDHPPERAQSRPRRHRHSSHRRRRQTRRWIRIQWGLAVPLVIFTALMVLAPLLFGAVDRVVQVALAGILCVGLAVVPPAWPVISRPVAIFGASFAAIALLKELAPASWFGSVQWRGKIDVALPWTHNPEPVRLLDVVITVFFAWVWLQWVRTLASQKERRLWMAWLLGGAGLLLAVVCFAIKVDPARPTAIYGIRETEGWVGWGPFPNRNHTSSFLAMAALGLVGCIWWAVAKRVKPLAIAGAVSLAVTLAALFSGKSRGALLAFGIGLLILLALVVWKKRDRRTVIIVVGIAAVATASVLAFGGRVLERFSSDAGNESSETRVLIWNEAYGMWKDAPVLGHGVGTFGKVFPLYQRADLDGKTVLHPESSWMQWLVELGALPLLGMAAGFAWFMAAGLRQARRERRGFYITAGMLAGALALLVHSVIDVPAHRWATAAYALALLGVAIPVPHQIEAKYMPRLGAVVPLLLACFWALPFTGVQLSWSTMTPTMLLNRQTRGGVEPSQAEWDAALRHFPLDPWLRQYAGLRALIDNPVQRGRWERDFVAVRALSPWAWWLPEMQAQAVAARFPVDSIPLWQEAVTRGGRQWPEILRRGVRATARISGSRVLWAQYIQLHPGKGLAFAQIVMDELKASPDSARTYFDIWWEHCGKEPIGDDDAAIFYRNAKRWSNPGQFEEWMVTHTIRRRKDVREWTALLHYWKQEERAWNIFTGAVGRPVPPSLPPGASRERLEKTLQVAANSSNAALELAELLDAEGDSAAAAKVVLDAAARPDAAPRLLREAAYRLAEQRRFGEAVEMALREK